jgi:6-O-methylguanine DNA methyltransferase, DNA binding domain
MAKRKTWRQKLADAKGLPRVEKITAKMSKRWGSGTVAIPAPAEVDAIMKEVPAGQLITIDEIRAQIARKHAATIACPLTTGIFAWIAAHAAQEAAKEGATDITPYWRTLKSGGELNPKYPGGLAGLKKLLRAEGHRVVTRGKRCFVADFETRRIAVYRDDGYSTNENHVKRTLRATVPSSKNRSATSTGPAAVSTT